MQLVKNWKKILLVSASFWAQVLGLVVLIGVEVRYNLTGADSDPALVWWISVLLLVFGLVGRFYTQDNPTWVEWVRKIGVIVVIILLAMVLSSTARAHQSCEADPRESAALDVAVPFIARWEGLSTVAYLDIVGVPTICYGSTRGVVMGMEFSKAQCDELLREEVAEYRIGWLDYVETRAYNNWLPANRDAAYTSLTYNVGIRAAGRSTATRRLNDGNIVGGCHAIGWWNKAGGRVIRGLQNRRSHETQLCLK